jgi:hypothetical protein
MEGREGKGREGEKNKIGSWTIRARCRHPGSVKKDKTLAKHLSCFVSKLKICVS